jgi:hypothetical protein
MKYIIFLLVIFFSINLYAQEGTITVIKKGEKAPFDGLLLDQEAAAKVLSEDDKQKEQCALDCKYKLDISKLEADLVVQSLKLDLEYERERHLSTITSYDSQLTALKDIKVEDDDDLMWFSVGAGSGAALVSILFGILWNVL